MTNESVGGPSLATLSSIACLVARAALSIAALPWLWMGLMAYLWIDPSESIQHLTSCEPEDCTWWGWAVVVLAVPVLIAMAHGACTVFFRRSRLARFGALLLGLVDAALLLRLARWSRWL